MGGSERPLEDGSSGGKVSRRLEKQGQGEGQ